jgi:hypothetical protein
MCHFGNRQIAAEEVELNGLTDGGLKDIFFQLYARLLRSEDEKTFL